MAEAVHAVRDADEWFDAAQATILSSESPAACATASGERSLPVDSLDRMHDRAIMTEYFRRQTEEVGALFRCVSSSAGRCRQVHSPRQTSAPSSLRG